VKAVRDKPELATLYGLIQASTFDNEKNLPDDYIPSLMDSYPPELIKAYLRGKFTNLTSGTIYHQFDRRLNNCTDENRPANRCTSAWISTSGKWRPLFTCYVMENRAGSRTGESL
jgi:hypothetical protein